MYTIKLKGFTLEETDSVVVVTRLTAAAVPFADTTLAYGSDGAYYSPPDLSLHIQDLGNPHLQREIIFPRIGRTYRIDGIELDMEVCNPCIVPGGTDHFHKMGKHRVDGEWGSGVITLYR